MVAGKPCKHKGKVRHAPRILYPMPFKESKTGLSSLTGLAFLIREPTDESVGFFRPSLWDLIRARQRPLTNNALPCSRRAGDCAPYLQVRAAVERLLQKPANMNPATNDRLSAEGSGAKAK